MGTVCLYNIYIYFYRVIKMFKELDSGDVCKTLNILKATELCLIKG